MLPLDLDVLRLSLHVLAATVWVGGQLTLAGLLPTLREVGDEAPRAVARRFQRIAWPAFGVLVVTGVWNLADVGLSGRSTEYQVTLLVKLVVVGVSAASALAHASARSKAVLAVGGALSAVSALIVVVLGTALTVGG